MMMMAESGRLNLERKQKQSANRRICIEAGKSKRNEMHLNFLLSLFINTHLNVLVTQADLNCVCALETKLVIFIKTRYQNIGVVVL